MKQKNGKNNPKNTPAVSLEEEVLALKEQVQFLTDALLESQKAYKEVLEGLSKVAEKDKKDKEEVSRWANQVEKRLGQLVVQQVNLSFVVDTAITLTEDQKEEIKRKVEELKEKNKSKKREG